MYPVTRTLTAASLGLSLVALAACGNDRSVNPVAEQVEGAAGAITTASTITAEYDLYPGQSVKINPKSTSRTNRLKWTTTNSGVAAVNSQGTVTAKVVGNAVVTVSGSGVLESYAVVVEQPTLTLTSFSLQPQASVTLTAGQTQQFSTSQTWSDGVTRTSGVTYTATGGTISSTGLYTAGSLAGAFMVVASCSCTTPAIADTTFVTVQAAAQLTKLTVSPKTVSLSAGASQQFAVTANWSTGATTVPPVTWTASGGTVSGTGAYVPPSTAGTYQVIVSHTGGTVRDTAVVTVSGESGGGTTIPGGLGNEPAGFRSQYSNPFTAAPPKNPLTDSYGFQNYSGSNYLPIMSEGGLVSPSFMRAIFPAGWAGGADYVNTFRAGNGFSANGDQSRLYVRMRFRISANWTDNGNTATKFFFFHQQEGNNHYVGLTEQGQLRPSVRMQSSFGYATPSGPNQLVPSGLAKGVWQDMEILLIANTPGVHNGIAKIWVNGSLLVNATDMGYFDVGQTPRFNGIYFNPTFGGGRNPVPADQYVDIDHWYVSTAP